MRAPTAGNLMLYSVIEVADPALKARLAETCDHQPFIARAPLVLVFVADLQKWVDRFAAAGCERLEGLPPKSEPGMGDFVLACCDALIAAQNAVVAAESLGIGSCYIGDIVERARPTPSCSGCRATRSPSPCSASAGPRAGHTAASATSGTSCTAIGTGA